MYGLYWRLHNCIEWIKLCSTFYCASLNSCTINWPSVGTINLTAQYHCQYNELTIQLTVYGLYWRLHNCIEWIKLCSTFYCASLNSCTINWPSVGTINLTAQYHCQYNELTIQLTVYGLYCRLAQLYWVN